MADNAVQKSVKEASKCMKFTVKARNFSEYLNALNKLSEPSTVATGKNKDANGVSNREQNITNVKGGSKNAENKGSETDRPINKLVVEHLLERARARKINESKH